MIIPKQYEEKSILLETKNEIIWFIIPQILLTIKVLKDFLPLIDVVSLLEYCFIRGR